MARQRVTINIEQMEDTPFKELKRFVLAIMDEMKRRLHHESEKSADIAASAIDKPNEAEMQRWYEIDKERYRVVRDARNLIQTMPKHS